MTDTKIPKPELPEGADEKISKRANLALRLADSAGKINTAADRYELAVVYTMACYMAAMNDASQTQTMQYIRNPVQDYIYGADIHAADPCMWMGGPSVIKLDPTLNLAEKNNMPLMTKLGDPCNIKIPGTGREILLGVRIGNPYHGFNRPVIVLGLTDDRTNPIKGHAMNIANTSAAIMEMPSMYATQIARAAKDVNRQIQHLVKTGSYLEDGPRLIVNTEYLKAERNRWTAYGDASRTCIKNEIDADDNPKTDYRGNLIQTDTNVPWLSTSGHRVLLAVENILKAGAGTNEPEDLKTISKLLEEKYRDLNVPPAIAENTAAVKKLAAHLGEQKYGKGPQSWKLTLPGE